MTATERHGVFTPPLATPTLHREHGVPGPELTPPRKGARTRWAEAYSHRLLITDTVVVIGAVLLAQYLRFGDKPSLDDLHSWPDLLSPAVVVMWLSTLAIFRTRSPRIIGSGIDEYRLVVSASFWTFGAIAIASLLFKIDPSRGYLAVALPVGTAGLLLARHLWRRQLARHRAHGHCQTMVLAIGERRSVEVLARELTRKSVDGYCIVGAGITGYRGPSGSRLSVPGAKIPVLGDESEALTMIREYGVDAVALTGTENFGSVGLRNLMWQLDAMDVDLIVTPGIVDFASQRLTVRPVSGYPLIHLEKPQYQGSKRFLKRTFDFCFAMLALIATSPILLTAAVAIKLTSRGPVFYSAERIGLDGRPFTMFKLRTMVQNAASLLPGLSEQNESDGGVLFKMRDDPRVTRVGRLLRRFSIDELPQFFNVLRQDMSVVGPRPQLRHEVNAYDGDIKRRLLVRPGLTGLWQVSGRSTLSWGDTVRLDLYYVENWSMGFDLVIILKTLRAVLTRHGAY